MRALLLFFVPLLAFAGSATLTWTVPTQNTDGTALPAGQITGYRMEWGSCTGTAPNYTFGTQAGTVTLPATPLTTTINNLPAGLTCFRAYTQANGNESAPTNAASKVIPSPIPNPPGSLNLTVSSVQVFKMNIKINAAPTFSLVGTVPIGTPCDASAAFAGMYVVDRDLVKFPAGVIKPAAVYARCGDES